eukprot:IDg19909t1
MYYGGGGLEEDDDEIQYCVVHDVQRSTVISNCTSYMIYNEPANLLKLNCISSRATFLFPMTTSVSTNDSGNVLQCPHCDSEFISPILLGKHVLRMHRNRGRSVGVLANMGDKQGDQANTTREVMNAILHELANEPALENVADSTFAFFSDLNDRSTPLFQNEPEFNTIVIRAL